MKKTVMNNEKILEVKDLRISFRTDSGTVKAVRGISFPLYKGRTMAIVGESGSGKSVTSKAILGILANNKIVEDGQIIYDGKDLLKISEEEFTKLRGVKISMIFQDPLSSLNPIMIVGKQLTEAMVLKHKADVKEAKKDLKKVNAALAKADAESVKQLVELAKKDFNKASLEGYKDLFYKASKLSVEERLLAIDKLLPELESAKNANFADEKEFSLLIKHLLGLKKTLKECTLSISNEADNDVEVFPSVLKYIETSIKEAAKQIGINRWKLYYYENGYFRPSSKDLTKLNDFYKSDISLSGADAYPAPS
ncbi:MAG: ABC transporter ATP-binding protein, partial [Bacilli bacterium]|nr:ABC transporter ATP-binding protein [Bacilli bacterium]